MAKKPNKECFTCSEKYYYCPSCSSEVKESYYNMFHCERCAKIFQSLTNEFLGKITTQECKKELLGLGVSSNEVFKDSIRTHINKVMGNNAKVEEIKIEEVKEKEIETKKIKNEEIKESELVSSIKDEDSKEVSKESEASELNDVKEVETKEVINVNKNVNKKFKNFRNSEVD